MIPNYIIHEMNRDCDILLNRALQGKTLACFGADGYGSYGTNTFAKYFSVDEITTKVHEGLDETLLCIAEVKLIGYDSSIDGHVFTDNNLKISMNKLFMAQFIDPTWTWGDLSQQGPDYFTIQFNATQLLGW